MNFFKIEKILTDYNYLDSFEISYTESGAKKR